MATDLRAAFELKLNDQLSGPMRKCMELVQRFQALAKKLGFKELDGADATVRALGKDIGVVNTQLGATARQAEAAASAIRRMSGAELGRVRDQAARMRAVGSGRTLDQIYGPGGMPLMAQGARFVPDEAGATSRMGWRGRVGNAVANTRERLGQANAQIGLAGGAMAGISLMEPIREAAEFDNVLTHIAITAGASASQVRGKVAEMAATYRKMALETRQSGHDVAESAQFLITTGIGEEMTNRLLPIIAKAATAYNTPMRDAVQGAFSMYEELGIKPEDMQGALSATALAAKQGHFSFSDFSSFLPSLAAQAATSGIKGREGLNTLLAALETSRRGAGTSGQAATNLQDFLSYINAPIGAHSFAKQGIDLPGLLQNAEKAGQNPIDAVTEAVRRRTTGMSDAQSANYIGKLFHNQEARIFEQTNLRELRYNLETRAKVAHAGVDTINEDFAKAQNLHTRLVELTESSHQLTQRVGTGFSWVVPVAAALLGGVLVGLQWMDQHLPGVAGGAIALTGGMLGLVAVMGVLGTVAGPIKAGAELLHLGGIMRSVFSRSALRLLVSPWLALPVLFGAAVYDIANHWSAFRGSFSRLWAGIRQAASGFGEFMSGVFSGDMRRTASGLQRIWFGVQGAWRSVWGVGGVMETLMQEFSNWLDTTWAAGLATGFGKIIDQSLQGWQKFFTDLKGLFDGFKPALPSLSMAPPDDYLKNPPTFRGDHPDAATPSAPNNLRHPSAYRLQAPSAPAPVEKASWDGTIHITADQGLRANASSGDERVRFTGAQVDRGRMLNRA